MLQLSDAVWATTRGVGRVYRSPTEEGVGIIQGRIGRQQRADDFDYVPKVHMRHAHTMHIPCTHHAYACAMHILQPRAPGGL